MAEAQRSTTLLARAAIALRRQDWLTVAIELTLVVAGILIAIEEDQWNDAREASAREDYYLEWLVESLDESIELTSRAEQRLRKKAPDAFWVAERMHQCDLGEEDHALFEARFLAVGPWDQPVFIDAALNELRAIGTSDLIRDPELRQRLARFEFDIRIERDSVDYLKRMLAQSNVRRVEGFDIRYEGGEERLVTTYEELCGLAELRRQIRWHGQGYAALERRATKMRIRMTNLRDELLTRLAVTR